MSVVVNLGKTSVVIFSPTVSTPTLLLHSGREWQDLQIELGLNTGLMGKAFDLCTYFLSTNNMIFRCKYLLGISSSRLTKFMVKTYTLRSVSWCLQNLCDLGAF